MGPRSILVWCLLFIAATVITNEVLGYEITEQEKNQILDDLNRQLHRGPYEIPKMTYDENMLYKITEDMNKKAREEENNTLPLRLIVIVVLGISLLCGCCSGAACYCNKKKNNNDRTRPLSTEGRPLRNCETPPPNAIPLPYEPIKV